VPPKLSRYNQIGPVGSDVLGSGSLGSAPSARIAIVGSEPLDLAPSHSQLGVLPIGHFCSDPSACTPSDRVPWWDPLGVGPPRRGPPRLGPPRIVPPRLGPPTRPTRLSHTRRCPASSYLSGAAASLCPPLNGRADTHTTKQPSGKAGKKANKQASKRVTAEENGRGPERRWRGQVSDR